MKFEDLKLVQKWREYAGPKDERLEAENAKIYKIGFGLLSFGMLMILFYEIIARQVAWVHSDASEMPQLFATPAEAAMYTWLVIVMLICVVLQTRKGYVDTNRFGQTEHLPVGYIPTRLRYQRSHEHTCHRGDALHCRGADRAVRKCLLGGELGDRRGLRHDDFHSHIRRSVRIVLHGEKRRAKIEAELDDAGDI